ncbi:MAG: PilW family protein [Aquabacterium sp.]|uniref:PilW family protein n=1 Tax=Aquabacterium sp. TaxID=1872578 RepID=UPI0025B90EAD|nr:PilW family protein [Aquabacterium sp.]MBI3382537.1 PilW family protein [Aquabacterium sp.]
MQAPSYTTTQRGFSLVEIMVGLVIGMATVVIMLQMLSNSDATKRKAAGGNDAQMNGTLALYTLEREIRASGYGINDQRLLGCDLTYKTSTDGATVTVPLQPTTVLTTGSVHAPAVDAKTDALLVIYSNNQGSADGDKLLSNSSAGSYQVSTPSTYNINDVIIAQNSARPSPCALTTDKVLNINGSTLTVNPGVMGMLANSVIYNMGGTPVINVYAIRNGNLTVCDYTAWDCSKASYANPVDSNVWVPIASNIVAMRAQYGHDLLPGASGGGLQKIVSQYDQITPDKTTGMNGFTTDCSWARTLAVRIALVARNTSYDKTEPTKVTPVWSGSTADGVSSPANPTALPFDLSGNGDWKKYRYKSMETTVPLRNAIWQGGSTCS